jgi:hypothetical protein
VKHVEHIYTRTVKKKKISKEIYLKRGRRRDFDDEKAGIRELL